MTNRIYVEMLASMLDSAVPHHTQESALLTKMLLYIALNPGACVRELGQEFDVHQTTVCRTVGKLRGGQIRGRRWHSSKRGMVRCCNKRSKRHTYELTGIGERFVSRLARGIPEANQKILMANV